MYTIKDGFHIQMFWISCHWGKKKKDNKKIRGWKKILWKMFSHNVFQTIASKGVHKKDIEELEKKRKQFYLKVVFTKHYHGDFVNRGTRETYEKTWKVKFSSRWKIVFT